MDGNSTTGSCIGCVSMDDGVGDVAGLVFCCDGGASAILMVLFGCDDSFCVLFGTDSRLIL